MMSLPVAGGQAASTALFFLESHSLTPLQPPKMESQPSNPHQPSWDRRAGRIDSVLPHLHAWLLMWGARAQLQRSLRAQILALASCGTPGDPLGDPGDPPVICSALQPAGPGAQQGEAMDVDGQGEPLETASCIVGSGRRLAVTESRRSTRAPAG